MTRRIAVQRLVVSYREEEREEEKERAKERKIRWTDDRRKVCYDKGRRSRGPSGHRSRAESLHPPSSSRVTWNFVDVQPVDIITIISAAPRRARSAVAGAQLRGDNVFADTNFA